MTFVDTGAWYASVIADDENHDAAREWLKSNVDTLCTTDYIIDETLTLLKARGHFDTAVALEGSFFAEELANLIIITEDHIQKAWHIFRQFIDKDWSFTDCTSKVVIDRLHIPRAFSFDHHFLQFGSVIVLP